MPSGILLPAVLFSLIPLLAHGFDWDRSNSAECLTGLARGSWVEKDWVVPGNNSCALRDCHPAATQQCLAKRWVYIVGDSSMRMLFSALVYKLNGSSLLDERFGSFTKHLKGGCAASEEERDGHKTLGCLREFYSNTGTRVTFSFQAYGQHPNQMVRNLVSASQRPDIMLVSFGAWTVAYSRDKNGGYLELDCAPDSPGFKQLANKTGAALTWIRNIYSGPIAFFTMTPCISCPTCPDFQRVVPPCNRALAHALHGDVNNVVVDRETSTIGLKDK